MEHIQLLVIIYTSLLFMQTNAQTENQWNGKKCAVVLTYDDALNVHLDNVIPSLDSVGFKGTFYIVGDSPVLSQRVEEWRAAAADGHELGNHTLCHPCNGELPGRSWVAPEKDLSKYTVERAINEIRFTNTLLKAVDGKTIRTFAFPCGDMHIDSVNYYSVLENEFAGARGVQDGMPALHSVDLNNINCYFINGQEAEYLINLVKKAMDSHSLLVFLFHGVGGEHSLNVSLEAHSKLIQFLKQHENEIWVAPLVDVATFVRKNQATIRVF